MHSQHSRFDESASLDGTDTQAMIVRSRELGSDGWNDQKQARYHAEIYRACFSRSPITPRKAMVLSFQEDVTPLKWLTVVSLQR